MSIQEYILYILASMKPILPCIIGTVVITLATAVVLQTKASRTWLSDRGFSLPGLFFGLDTKGTVRLACTWMKMCFLIIMLVVFRRPETIQYIAFFMVGITAVVLAGGVKKVAGAMFWFVLETAGLLCANVICAYILDMSPPVGFMLTYIGISIFLVLFEIYLFMLDVINISAQRNIDPYSIWRR